MKHIQTHKNHKNTAKGITYKTNKKTQTNKKNTNKWKHENMKTWSFENIKT